MLESKQPGGGDGDGDTTNFVNIADDLGVTPLHNAVQRGDSCLEMIEMLLLHGADVNAADTDGETPLFAAAAADEGSAAVALLLLENGADVNRATPSKKGDIDGEAGGQGDAGTGADMATNAGADIGAGAGADVVDGAGGGEEVEGGGEDEEGEEGDEEEDIAGNTSPLAAAAMEGNTAVVEVLLRFEADVSIQDDTGKTAMQHAEIKGHDQIARLLKKSRAVA